MRIIRCDKIWCCWEGKSCVNQNCIIIIVIKIYGSVLLPTLVGEESSSSDKDDLGDMAHVDAKNCVDIMPLEALENLN